MPAVVEGIVAVRKALREFAPDLQKQMDDEIRVALKDVTSTAKAKVPGNIRLYNWQAYQNSTSRTSRERAFPAYNPTLIRRGLTYSMSRQRPNRAGFVSLYTLFNKNAAGAIVETSGRKNPSGDPQGQSNNPMAGAMFINSLSGQVGSLKSYKNGDQKTRGRLLYAAYAEKQGKTLDAIMKAIDNAIDKFEARGNQVRRAA